MKNALLPLRRTAPMPNSSKHANATAPCRHCALGVCGVASEALLAAVVEIVRVAVWLLVSEIETGDVVPKFKVGGSTAPTGELVSTAVSATLPVNPPVGVTVILEVLPVMAPGGRVTFTPLTVMAGTAGAVTITGSLRVPA